MRPITPWLVAVFLLLFTPAGRTEDPAEVRCDPQDEFRWLDSRFPSVTGHAFVRFRRGTIRRGAEQPLDLYDYGFLFEEDTDCFTLFTTNLLTARRSKRAAVQAGVSPYEELDLATFVRSRLAQPPVEGIGPRSAGFPFDGPSLRAPSDLVALAWFCSRRGLDDLAMEAYRHASALVRANGKAGATRCHLADSHEIAETLYWHAILEYESGTVTRREFACRLSGILNGFGSSRHAQRIEEMVGVLTTMVKEDAEHTHPEAGGSAPMPTEVRVCDLIFHLRDQRGGGGCIPGSCEFEGPPGDELVAIGLPAVPRLMEALGDPRLTRLVEDLRPYFFSHSVLRVGDAAVRILERVAGRSFHGRNEPTEGILMDGASLEVRRAVEAWWHEVEHGSK